MATMLIVSLLLVIASLSQIHAFRLSPVRRMATQQRPLRMAETTEEDGYDSFGSLTRQGLVPFVIRLVNPTTYDAAVDKYMKLEKVSKLEAMANMDAYFADPNGWAGRKMRERSGTAPKADYINANQNKGSLALTAVWAVGITGLFVRIFQVQVLGM